ncbi:MAG: ribosome maturation factor RimP [Acidimicrobiales bacterium]
MPSDDVCERVRDLVGPSLEEAGLELFDVEHVQGVLRVTVDRPGGVDLDAISDATRLISAVLDAADPIADALPVRYLLEVSSPGIERPLRRPEHFHRAVGQTVVVKTRPGVETERRVEGRLEGADDDGVVVAGRAIPYADIEKARTRFVWPEPRPASPRKAGAR